MDKSLFFYADLCLEEGKMTNTSSTVGSIEIGEHLGLNGSESQAICAIEDMADGRGWWVFFLIQTEGKFPSILEKISIPKDRVMGVLKPLDRNVRLVPPPWRSE
ncbi:hypothetical protein [Corticimicrobacter populi]|uniref:Uncharacterized protein n=1 Tax=Corticimicrobacter populi TaxID=2175229 RepID=A0A2V1K1C1_9BURK|nr:hypothetical protein [Corticimicrobacter populi]PWF25006.1 hypothetical protein DD235_02205 [Corticimicrobacter populi]